VYDFASIGKQTSRIADDSQPEWRRGVYHAFLERLTEHLRAYYRHRFALIGHILTKAEDLLQEVLIAMHTHRSHLRSVPAIHAVDLRNRALQVFGLSAPDQVLL
jgi:hypothetical protein